MRRRARAWSGMTALVVFFGVVLACWAGPAEARRRRSSRGKQEPLDVVVLPFSALSQKGLANEAKEALELELELIDTVRVQDAETVHSDLEDLGDEAFEATALSAVLRRRGVEVLVATPPDLSKAMVVAYAADGHPRVFRELPRGAGADQIAATTIAALKPALGKWATLKPQKLPAPTGRPGGDDRDDVVDEDDVLAEVDRTPKPKKKKEPDPPDAKPSEDSGDTPPRRTEREGRSRRSLDDDEAPPPRRTARGLDDDDRPARALEAALTRRRAALDDSDGDTLAESGRRSLLDVEDEAPGGGGPVKPTHLIGLSGTFDGATWHYSFDGNGGVAPDPVTANFYPGGSVRLDVWPFESVGVDASASLATVQFQINSGPNLEISPSKFVSWQVNAGAAAKARWLFRFSDDGLLRVAGLGGRVGYRYWSASVESQVVNGTGQNLTVVPGFQLHGLAAGPELYLPLFLGDRRLEIELKIDTLPATYYTEEPDNPGGTSLAFGYHAELLARFDLFGGFFIEAAGKSTGTTISFEGQGDRVTVDGGNNLVTLKGGRSLNVAGGFSVGVGFMY